MFQDASSLLPSGATTHHVSHACCLFPCSKLEIVPGAFVRPEAALLSFLRVLPRIAALRQPQTPKTALVTSLPRTKKPNETPSIAKAASAWNILSVHAEFDYGFPFSLYSLDDDRPRPLQERLGHPLARFIRAARQPSTWASLSTTPSTADDMISVPVITIPGHTTASTPRPHILYTVHVNKNGKGSEVKRRYSEFVQLHDILKDPFNLPPKRLLVTTFLPSAWADDALISERKAGLAAYLTELASSSTYKYHTALHQFLLGESLPSSEPSDATNTDGGVSRDGFDLEDALPSTLPRKAALRIAAMAAGGQAVGLRPTGADVLSVDAASKGTNASTANAKAGDGQVNAAAPATGMHYAAYYPGWSAGTTPPEKIDFSKFDIIYFAFAMPNSNSGLTWEGSDKDVLRRLVTSAKKSGKGTKIVLSVGGWGGCYWFSQAVSTANNRTKFVNALKDAVNNYGLDGIDIDWEYPNSPGAGNPYSPNDSANLLSFLKALRTALGKTAIIAAAVSHLPWLGSNGRPLTNVKDYAAVMTYINIMNYDVWGASGTPGPNAPMGNLCGTSKQPQASAQAAVSQWKAAGFPANKVRSSPSFWSWYSHLIAILVLAASDGYGALWMGVAEHQDRFERFVRRHEGLP
ncbi:hypothetical protein NMY22_g5822 [Coprinellus aureogranulatus]|nr:hypothetical protein NMY22_g5822 [Coprinellus aureogranulatus]